MYDTIMWDSLNIAYRLDSWFFPSRDFDQYLRHANEGVSMSDNRISCSDFRDVSVILKVAESAW